MRVPWKLSGLAGAAGVAASGVVAVQRRRSHREYDPEELREKLHARLAGSTPPQATAGPAPRT